MNITLEWLPNLIDGKSTMFQVMAWCRQAPSHYLIQCWPRSLTLSEHHKAKMTWPCTSIRNCLPYVTTKLSITCTCMAVSSSHNNNQTPCRSQHQLLHAQLPFDFITLFEGHFYFQMSYGHCLHSIWNHVGTVDLPQLIFNPLRAKFFRGNINILCHFSTLIRRR